MTSLEFLIDSLVLPQSLLVAEVEVTTSFPSNFGEFVRHNGANGKMTRR